jgi:hypothetical protein
MKHRKYFFFLIAFLFTVLFPLSGKNNNKPFAWTNVEKIVAVGDIHGDFHKFIQILIGTGLTDERMNWTGGKAHLVQLGDVLDRGDHAKMVFDLLKRLETEAEEAGGMVHMLLGNHEEVNITGSAFQFAGYITLRQFISFLDPAERKKAEKSFRMSRGEKVFKSTDPPLPLDDPEVKAFWTEKMNSPDFQPKYHNAFYNNYGKWLLTHNAVIKINDIVFAHGGISEKLAGMDLAKMNRQIVEEMKIVRGIFVDGRLARGFYPKFVNQENSPLWYRDLANRPEDVFKRDVDNILEALDAKYIVIGHTTYRGQIQSKEDLSRFNGRVWTIDTGMSSRYGGIPTALVYENGEFSLWGLNNEQ